jgi:hypothetical protein
MSQKLSVLYEVPPTDRATPLTTAITMITRTGVWLVISPAAATEADRVTDAAIRMVRNPYLLRRYEVAGLIPMFPTKTNKTRAPDLTADQPKTVSNSSGSRNGTAATAMKDSDPLVTATRNVETRSVRKSISGSGTRRRCRTARTSRPAAGTPTPATVAHDGADWERRLAA